MPRASDRNYVPASHAAGDEQVGVVVVEGVLAARVGAVYRAAPETVDPGHHCRQVGQGSRSPLSAGETGIPVTAVGRWDRDPGHHCRRVGQGEP